MNSSENVFDSKSSDGPPATGHDATGVSEVGLILRGIAVTLVGVFALAPAPLVIRLAGGSLDLWTYILLRQAFLLPLLLCVLLLRDATVRVRGEGMSWNKVLNMYRGCLDRSGWIAAFLLGFVQNMMPWSVMEANTAVVMGILAMAPFWSAICSWVIDRQRTTNLLWISSLGVFSGVILLCYSSLTSGSGYGIVGLLLSFATSIAWGGLFYFSKRSYQKNPSFDLLTCNFVAGLIAFGLAVICGLILPGGFQFSALYAPGGLKGVFWCALHGIAIQPIAFFCHTAGTKYLLAAQVSLLSLLEIPMAPFLTYLVFGEKIGLLGILGLTVIVAVLCIYWAIVILKQKKTTTIGEEEMPSENQTALPKTVPAI